MIACVLPASIVVTGCSSDDIETADTTPHLNRNDSLAMVNIYKAIGPWDSQWDINDISTWDGLEMAVDEATNEVRIVGFEVYNGTFHGSLPAEICKLTELRRLVLTGGDLRGNIPENIGDLRHLIVLTLGSNKISGKIPESIGQLKDIRHLDFRFNELDDTVPESIGKLENLEYLYIYHTRVHGNIPKSLANLKNLKRAELSENHFSGVFPIEILRKDFPFCCENNDITELPFEVWSDDKDIAAPLLQGNRLSGEVPDWVLETNKWKQDGDVCTRCQQEGYGYTNVTYRERNQRDLSL